MFVETKNLYLLLYNSIHVLHDDEGNIKIYIPLELIYMYP